MQRLIWLILIGFICLIALLAIGVTIYLHQPQFGQSPTGERLAKLEQSPNYREGMFRNLVEKPDITEGYSLPVEVYKTFFQDVPRREPIDPIPSIKTNLKALDRKQDVLVWFGHSSLFLQLDGKRFLIDPVFSGRISPLPGARQSYPGTDIYTVDDLPEIDYLLISHDHYDHLDYQTISQLKDKVKYVVSGLGVGEHFESWGYPKHKLIELDWGDKVQLGDGITLTAETAHHGSGRAFRRAKNLWISFIIQSPQRKIFYSGDSGYDPHFAEIGRKYGSFDWAIMENGQYNAAWRAVHSFPEDVAKATESLHARNMIPVHHSKFTLARHAWDEPIRQITKFSAEKNYRLATPMIGELVELDNDTQPFKQWWLGVR